MEFDDRASRWGKKWDRRQRREGLKDVASGQSERIGWSEEAIIKKRIREA